jgi:hypothetical protein
MQPQRDEFNPILAQLLVKGMQQKFSDDLGVICFSANLNSLLMWSHYADGHRGFVVEFDPKHSMFSPNDFDHVRYVQERHSVHEGGTPAEFKVLVMAKSKQWEDEAEWRLMIPNNRLQPVPEGKQTHYYLPLPEDAVKAVFLGCAMEPELRRAIVASLRRYRHGDIPLFVMVQAQNAYRLEANRNFMVEGYGET